MSSYEHTQILAAIRKIEERPKDADSLASWLRAEQHLQVLKNNTTDSEVIIYASSRVTFIHAEMARQSEAIPSDIDDLLDWNSTPFTVRAAFEWSGDRSKARVTFAQTEFSPRSLKHRQNFVFARPMEGMDEPTKFELLQEFIHATEIHWREEQSAYCRLDENGDLDPIVSISTTKGRGGVTLVTCKREPLEQYLAGTKNVLVRFFDFTMVNHATFTSWDAGVRERKIETAYHFFNQCIHPDGHAFTRGAQVLPVTTPKNQLFNSIGDPISLRNGREYASFIADDWRNEETREISTDPVCTTNYFVAHKNSLPFELSPAFFRPEVLSKYKADGDKYTIDESTRTIWCRGAWYLRGFGINEAGQVHAYICDLRNLPYQEQLYWKSHNEEPKGTISPRAYENDFLGQWSSHTTGAEEVLHRLHKWNDEKYTWWKVEAEDILLRINTPLTNGKDEWAQAFLNLSKAVIEGFQVKPIRALLQQEGVPFDGNDGTIRLLERLVVSQIPSITELEGLRLAQSIRSKVHSHREGTAATVIARSALLEHGTYRFHFEHACDLIVEELDGIERLMARLQAKQQNQPGATAT